MCVCHCVCRTVAQFYFVIFDLSSCSVCVCCVFEERDIKRIKQVRLRFRERERKKKKRGGVCACVCVCMQGVKKKKKKKKATTPEEKKKKRPRNAHVKLDNVFISIWC